MWPVTLEAIERAPGEVIALEVIKTASQRQKGTAMEFAKYFSSSLFPAV